MKLRSQYQDEERSEQEQVVGDLAEESVTTRTRSFPKPRMTTKISQGMNKYCICPGPIVPVFVPEQKSPGIGMCMLPL